MSLTIAEQVATRKELQENFAILNWSLDQVAEALQTTPAHLQAVLALEPAYIEEPWILKCFLEEKIRLAGREPVAFTALVGNPEDYWFLKQRRIQSGVLAPQ
ncbi:DUF2316 family protein [Fructobacillus evanidus]|uniref:DUF2316 domain n=1 Tax=Fructobacillus evanidus TaxID=3064281 RepID=A0ABM9MW85_9LACO|nr:DUF2316 domain [Fructobacillus sp. LMG 32999]CAK1229516.1 DUF2316 domain [Fructobacillus sp. LMG 32999]CAK1232325.1 DUF2316 domain [Fructobacillus sp. LMG 32999]CAK1232470.1 DUF2316 domain [Fructobacillus sp. LMG 32999]CAK1233579.1 DUF2316 domain [Fructobacillus sp. LMG 32999]